MMRFAALIIFLFLWAVFLPSFAYSQSLIINDCYGFTRSAKSVDSGELSRVEVRVESTTGAASNGANVTLTNVVSGEVMTASVQSGLVTFNDVPPGVFELATTQEGLQMGALWISPMGAAPFVAGAALIGTGGIAAGGVAGVAAAASNSSGGGDDDDNVLPTPVPTPGPTAQPTEVPSPCKVCDAEATPKPIEDFAQYQQLSPST